MCNTLQGGLYGLRVKPELKTFIKKPYASIKTDNGAEFKGVFKKYLYNESIYHSKALPYRHKQLSNVNNLSNPCLIIIVNKF